MTKLACKAIGVAWLIPLFAVIGVIGAPLSVWFGEETAQKPLPQEATVAPDRLSLQSATDPAADP